MNMKATSSVGISSLFAAQQALNTSDPQQQRQEVVQNQKTATPTLTESGPLGTKINIYA